MTYTKMSQPPAFLRKMINDLINEILKNLTDDGTFEKIRIGSHWGYKRK